MNKCNRCNIEVLDKSLSCPLCNGVLTIEDEKKTLSYDDSNINSYDEESSDSDNDISMSVMYPDIEPMMKRMRFVTRLVIFCSIVVEGLLILINYLTYNKVKWSIICGVALAYGCFTFIYSVQHNTSHRTKLMMQILGTIIVVIAIDIILGYSGWSLNIALPCIIFFLDSAIVLYMILDRTNWQSYILLQIYSVLLCLIFTFIMIFTELFHFKILMIIADAVSLFLLGATIAFGDRRATTELKRRFHV
jgi:hypothetical protein